MADLAFTDDQNNPLMIVLGETSTLGTFIYDANSHQSNTDAENTDEQRKVQSPIRVVSQCSNTSDENCHITTMRRSVNIQNTYTFTYSGCN